MAPPGELQEHVVEGRAMHADRLDPRREAAHQLRHELVAARHLQPQLSVPLHWGSRPQRAQISRIASSIVVGAQR